METNESFKLLGLSPSDSGSDISEFVLTAPRKKRRKRRIRGASSPSLSQVKESRCCYFKKKCVALSITALLLLCWLIVITWLALMLHGEIRRLDTNVRGVVAGSQGVPDALQKCHSMSRDLQQNQTALFNHLAVLSLQTGNFSTQLVSLQSGLQNLEERLKATPELVNVPQDLKELRANVAMFGSQIRDLETTVSTLKDQYSQLQDTSKILVQNVTGVQGSFELLLDAERRPHMVQQEDQEEKTNLLNEIAQMAVNITKVNNTLISKLTWLVDDQHNDHRLIEALQNVGQNVSARVTTLEGECARQSALSSLNSTVKTLAAKLNNESTFVGDLDKKVSMIQSQHEKSVQQLPITSPIKLPNARVEPVSDASLVSFSSAPPTSQQPTPSSVQPAEQTARP